MSDDPPAQATPRKSRITAATKEVVRERANGCCEYCMSQDRLATQGFAAEHILPQEKGGTNEPDNLALACPGCNNHKFTKTTGTDLESGVSVPLFHPRRERWRNHFAWDADKTRILGKTPTGRATVDALQLNRERLVNQRAAFVVAGLHPPPDSSD